MADKSNIQHNKIVEDEEEEKGCCARCCSGCERCIVACCSGIYNCIVGIKICILSAISSVWYPIRERCERCCDDCNKKNNPWSDPKYNPYDNL